MKLEFSRQIFRKILKFHENPASGSRAEFLADRRTVNQTDTTKLTVAFRTFKNWKEWGSGLGLS